MLFCMLLFSTALRAASADNFLMLFNPFSQSHIFHLLPITKELLREVWSPVEQLNLARLRKSAETYL